LFNELLTKIEGGRLNVSRAIDLARAHLKVKIEGEIREYAGKMVKYGQFPPETVSASGEYIECRLSNRERRQIKWIDLRRMFYDEPRRKYVLFYNSVEGSRDSPLRRITDCDLTTRSHDIEFEADPNAEKIAFKALQIRDYISEMF
jgi:hypothetical protein